MHWAMVSVKRENRRGLVLGLLFTLILGLTFLGVQVNEYRTLGWTPENGRVLDRLLLPDRPARLARLRRRDAARDRAHPLIARPLLDAAATWASS